jgi:hypothetical protein
VIRGAVARSVLLAVALGFGIVRKDLSWPLTAAVVLLALMYTGADLTLEVLYIVFPADHSGKQENLGAKRDADLIVSIIDIVYLIWTFFAINRTISELERTEQHTKRSMYSLLNNLLILFAVVWIIMGSINAAVLRGDVQFPWKYLWVLDCYFEVLTWLVLATAAWIWRPGPETERYAYYSENLEAPASAGDDDEHDDDEDAHSGSDRQGDEEEGSSAGGEVGAVGEGAGAKPDVARRGGRSERGAAIVASEGDVELTEVRRERKGDRNDTAAAESARIVASDVADEEGYDVEWPDELDDMDDPVVS